MSVIPAFIIFVIRTVQKMKPKCEVNIEKRQDVRGYIDNAM